MGGSIMMPGMNSRQMRQMMQKMGVQQQELDAQRVIIELEGKRLVFNQPQVSKVNMMGQVTYQLVGTAVEEELDTTPEINDDDIQTVMDQAGVSEDKAREALEETHGDLAEAILKLQDE
jgi:nascent polypeptide-associated complex subunit alpha